MPAFPADCGFITGELRNERSLGVIWLTLPFAACYKQ